jgi:hypothetical protein
MEEQGMMSLGELLQQIEDAIREGRLEEALSPDIS